MNRSDPQIESAAQIIYAVVQQHSHEGARYPWQDGGNSLVQDLCRDAARKILTTPTTAGEPVGIDLREQAARIIYDDMRRLDSVGRKFPWQDGGNSDAQTVARLAAVKVLKLTTPAADQRVTHASDCAIHNAPALPVGPCDCGASPADQRARGTGTEAQWDARLWRDSLKGLTIVVSDPYEGRVVLQYDSEESAGLTAADYQNALDSLPKRAS